MGLVARLAQTYILIPPCHLLQLFSLIPSLADAYVESTDAPSYISVVVENFPGVMLYLMTVIVIRLVIHFRIKGELWVESRIKRWSRDELWVGSGRKGCSQG